MSLALLQATQTVRPSVEGWAQVGEQLTWPVAIAVGGPSIPFSAPGATMKWRETASRSASISTSTSFIMQTE